MGDGEGKYSRRGFSRSGGVRLTAAAVPYRPWIKLISSLVLPGFMSRDSHRASEQTAQHLLRSMPGPAIVVLDWS